MRLILLIVALVLWLILALGVDDLTFTRMDYWAMAAFVASFLPWDDWQRRWR